MKFNPILFFRAMFSFAVLLLTNETYGNCCSQKITVEHLTVNCQKSPQGIDSSAPLLGWRIYSDRPGVEQGARQILVASRKELLKPGLADVWDSGKRPGPESQNVRYEGAPLLSGTRYYWRVRIWDQKDRPTQWSGVSEWSTGFLSPEAWRARWISAVYSDVNPERNTYLKSWGDKSDDYVERDTAAVYMRRGFDVGKRVKRATAYVCGLGYYELYINGRRVGDRVLDPVFADYQVRIGYATYEIGDLLQRGGNAVGVILGNGHYNTPTRDMFQMENAKWKTPVKLLAELHIEYADGSRDTVLTDGSWRWSNGEIVYNSVRSGETIDRHKTMPGWSRAEFEDAGWSPVHEVPAPLGRMYTPPIEPVRIIRTLPALKVSEPKPGVYVVDFGENLTGWIRMKVRAEDADTVKCDYNEHLTADGTLDLQRSKSHTRGRYQRSIFIPAEGRDEVFESRFAYHGFRYVQLEGLKRAPRLSDLTAAVVHTDLRSIGTFCCSDKGFNDMQAAVRRTLLNSIHGMPGEEATREKMGWTLDAAVTMESYLNNFASIGAYKKCLQDYLDAQEASGHIPSIVPTSGWSLLKPDGDPIFWDDPWWGGSIFLIVENLYNYTGDPAIIEDAFEAMKRYVDFLATTADDGIVSWSLGDWLDMNHTHRATGTTPVAITSTIGYYYMCDRLSAFARKLGRPILAEQYAEKALHIRDRFNGMFLNRETGWYKENSQTAQALPLFFGLVPDDMKNKVDRRLLDAIERNGNHINSGFVGTNFILEYLCLSGHGDKAFEIVSQKEAPGWLHMVRDNKSTMGENINVAGYGNGHHPYGAHIGFWLYKYLGGIRYDPRFPGFKKYIIEPMFVPGMDSVSVATESLYGEMRSRWERNGDDISLDIVVPANTSARLLLPAMNDQVTITADKLPIGNHPFIKTLAPDGTKRSFQIPSGRYRFLLKNIPAQN